MPKIVIDEDLHRSLAEVFKKLKFDEVKNVRDCSLSGASDNEVFNFAKKNKAILVSGDLGFANILSFPLKSHYGIIILRFPNEMPISMIDESIDHLLKNIPISKLKNALTILSPTKARIRK